MASHYYVFCHETQQIKSVKQFSAIIGEAPDDVGVNVHLVHVLLLTVRSRPPDCCSPPYLCPLLSYKGLQVQCSRNV